MPYKIKTVVGGYKVAKKSEPTKTYSKKPLTLKKAKAQKKAIEISESMMKRLKKHSKMHGGMGSAHMRSMKKFIKMGDSFNLAHQKSS